MPLTHKISDVFASTLHIDPRPKRAFNAIPNIPKRRLQRCLSCPCSVYSFLTACVIYTWGHRATLSGTHTLTHICHPLSAMMIQFGCSSSTRNGLKCAQVEYFKLLVSVLAGYMLILIDRLKAVSASLLPLLSVCLSVWRLVKLIPLCCTFPLRHVLDKTSSASREQGCICCLKLMDDVGTVCVLYVALPAAW